MLLANSIARYAQWIFIEVMATSFFPPGPVLAQLPEIDSLSDEEPKTKPNVRKTTWDELAGERPQLICPAIELVDVAHRAGRLEELTKAIQQSKPVGQLGQRCKHALLASG